MKLPTERKGSESFQGGSSNRQIESLMALSPGGKIPTGALDNFKSRPPGGGIRVFSGYRGREDVSIKPQQREKPRYNSSSRGKRGRI